ncbi:MAG TPA: hypothetical protein VN712_05700 [Dermatophilaceae bacterium]|nr:hypothetical protein [Dermatophilaceae bacterium]
MTAAYGAATTTVPAAPGSSGAVVVAGLSAGPGSGLEDAAEGTT